jgi:PAS domain S-box-containing protein
MMHAKLSHKPIFVIEPDLFYHDQLIGLLSRWGYRVESAPCATQTISCIQATEPCLVILNADNPEGYTLVGEIRAALPETLIFTTSAPETQQKIMEQLKYLVDDFLTLPIAPVALEISLARAFRIQELLGEVKSTCSRQRTAQTCENVAREVENERFLAVRQMVEKISAFIADVTTGAQGDLRFYNEIPYFISVHSPDCRVLAANSVYLKYFGNRLYGNSWDIYVGKRATRAECPVGRTAATNNVQINRSLVRYKSGARVPVLVHTAPIYNNEGEVALVLEVFAGTQEIDQLARQIRTTQQRYRQLFNAIPSYAVVLDRHQCLTAANQKFTEEFGDHLGRKFFDIFRPAAFPAHREPISQTYRDGVAHQGEMMLTAANGRTYSVMAWTNPILTTSGKMIQVLIIFTDITELRQLKDNLATLGLMVSTVSHDLKGFLTGLDAGLYHVDKGFYRNQPGRIEEGLETAKLMSDRIRKMVLNVLFSCKERQLERQKTDAAQFASEVASVIANRIRGADIDFICDYSNCTGMVNVDRELLRTALVNILENALEACLEDPDPKKHLIEFKVFSQADQVTFLIKDNGPGMTPDQLSQIFTIFYSSKGRGGTGLGMFITQRVIENHYGTIQVQSEPSQGTTFTVRLPRRADL